MPNQSACTRLVYIDSVGPIWPCLEAWHRRSSLIGSGLFSACQQNTPPSDIDSVIAPFRMVTYYRGGQLLIIPHMCMYVFMYACTCLCVCMCVYIYIYIHIRRAGPVIAPTRGAALSQARGRRPWAIPAPAGACAPCRQGGRVRGGGQGA